MRSLRVLAGGLVALAILGGASAAAAAKYVFDIQVTERFGPGPFTPFSFQQAWVFSPAPVTTGVIGDPPVFVQRSITPATATASLLTSAILAELTLEDDGLPANATGRTLNYVEGGTPFLTNGLVILGRQMLTEAPIGDGTFDVADYSMVLEASGDFPTVQPQRLDAGGFADLLDTLGTFRFFEGGSRSIFDPAGAGGQGSYQQQALYVVLGTATFNRAASVVPEPHVWGLMVLGLFGAGGLLRHRRLSWRSH
jgi:hypothetical protein